PAYINDVPEVLYEDLWISPDMIIFTGLEQPSDSHVLVFKMSPALSPGVSSGWGQTVIITPGLAPDWGDADLTALYTSVMGVAPEAGKKYFCEFYWLDKKTGFTGESMAISAVCKEGSTAYAQEYVPRTRVTDVHLAEGGQLQDLDLEFSPGSAICTADVMLLGHHDTAMSEAILVNPPANLPVGEAHILARATAENNYIPQTYRITIREWLGEWTLRFGRRGGHYEKPSEVHGTAIFYEA
ncbi:MAG: hypothetical protein IJ940_01355, partial [Bacteroidales bacterium]|nr:hypothetical protein [Bacteroidales bacterium]